MTYGELREKLGGLTPEQLAQNVTVSCEAFGSTDVELWIAEEDWLGDAGDEASPRSAFTTPEELVDVEEMNIYIAEGAVRIVLADR